MRLMLDTNILARLCHPSSHRDVQEWFRRLLLRGADAPEFLVSVLADYELRRMLARIGAGASLAQFDNLARSMTYVPVTPEATRRAADIWEQVRRGSATTARPPLSDADILMAAQAELEGAVLVTSDRAIRTIAGITAKDWNEVEAT